MTDEQRAELDAAMAKIGAPICPEWTYSAIRHCQRNMDLDVSDGFNEPDRQCGGSIAEIVNAYPGLTAHIDAQAAQIARMREALARYGHHDARCASNTMLTSLPPKRNPCDCGLSAALAGDA